MPQKSVQELEDKIALLEIELQSKNAEIQSLKNNNSSITSAIFQNELFNCLMEVMPQAVYFKDRRGNYIRLNRSSMNQLKVKHEDDILGKSNYDFFDKVYADQVQKDEDEVIRSGVSLFDKEELVVTQDGREWWESATRMPLKTSSGKIMGTFGIWQR